jgi:hypothetical protein
MATRERAWREGGPELGLRGVFLGGSSAVLALNRPDPELEPEKEDVRAPNIAVFLRLPMRDPVADPDDTRDDLTHSSTHQLLIDRSRPLHT